jgi:hypothetical protein
MVPVVTLQGGLGNQLFQWFFAHTINDKEFRLTTHTMRIKSTAAVRNTEISPLIDNCNHFIGAENNQPGVSPGLTILFRGLSAMWEKELFRYFLELNGYIRDDLRSNFPKTSRLPKRILFADGYFQANATVESVWPVAERELLPYLKGLSFELMKSFNIPEQFTAIHVRRADKVENDIHAKEHIGILNDDYFINALNVESRPFLVVFTENKSQIEELCARIKPDLILDSVSLSAWDTLALMSNASTFIGSNSSLSWWGAKVAAKSGKSAILPNSWSQHHNIDSILLNFESLRYCNSIWM